MPNWIDLENLKSKISNLRSHEVRQKLGIAPEQKVVLFVHRLSRRKGADLLPDILRELRDQNAVLVVVGDGPERQTLESRIKNYELWERVRLVGGVPNREVFQYFAIADAFLMSSEEEGFPHVLLEAMAMGVPFVASEVGAVSEMTPAASREFLVKDRRADAFAMRVRMALGQTPSQREALARLLQEHVRRYDIERVALRFVRMVESVWP